MNNQTKGLSRRDAMRWTGLAGVAMLWSQQAGKAAVAQELITSGAMPVKSPEPQGAGYYRTTLGDMNLIIVSDGQLPLPSAYPTIGANVGEAAVNKGLEEAFITPGPIWLQVNGLVIQSGKNVLLVDTGCGKLLGPTLGKLVGNLANAGFAPSDVTHLLITHLHRDHVGGLFDADGKSLFPKAKVFVHEQELAFWSQPEPDMSKSGIPKESLANFVQTIQVAATNIKKIATLLQGQETEIIPGVSSVLAKGHTPGHQILRLVSGDQRMIYMTDLMHYPSLLMPHPDWYVAFDTDRDMAVQTRLSHFEEYAQNRVLLAGAHLPFPGFGHVRKVGQAYEWVPTQWQW